jgi:hypothetical protein
VGSQGSGAGEQPDFGAFGRIFASPWMAIRKSKARSALDSFARQNASLKIRIHADF